MTFNLYPDPSLATVYSQGGSAMTHVGNTFVLVAAGAGNAQAMLSSNPSFPDLMDRIAAGGLYHVSVNVANYVGGDGRAKLCAGSYADLGVTGNGWSTPAPVIAGASRFWGAGFYGSGNLATFDIVPDENGEAVRITT